MKKDNFSLLVLISIFIYLLACCMPAYLEARNPTAYTESTFTEYVEIPGWGCMLFGWIYLPICAIMGYFWAFIWVANAYYIATIIFMRYSIKRKWLIVSSMISIAIGSVLLFISPHYSIRDDMCWIESLLGGYYLWLLSFITLFVGLLVSFLPNAVRSSFSYILSTAFIISCAYIIEKTSNRGDNTIWFDEDSQCIVANSSIETVVIDDGTNVCLLRRDSNIGTTVVLKDIFFSFAVKDCGPQNIVIEKNCTYEIINQSHIRAPKYKIRIEIDNDGNAKSTDVPLEEGDNSFYVDIPSQSLVTSSYFSSLVIEDENRLFWLDYKGLKRSIVPLNRLNLYFSESNDSILPLKANHSYIINNNTHLDRNVYRIKIHIDQNGDVDSSFNLPPTKYV